MFNLKLEKDDEDWLRANYPELQIKKGVDSIPVIEGLLHFDMVFYDENKSYIIKPEAEHLTRGHRIQDEYKIEIVFKTSEHSNLPQVYERGNRIEMVSKNRSLKPEDLHINPSGAMCLCLNIQEEDYLPNGFNVADFFNNLVIPFFYAQSFFEKTKIWKWGQYGHGSIAFFEWYLKQEAIGKEKVEKLIVHMKKRTDWVKFQLYLLPSTLIKGHHECLCGSKDKLKFRNCHKNALHGLWKLKKDIKDFCVKL